MKPDEISRHIRRFCKGKEESVLIFFPELGDDTPGLCYSKKDSGHVIRKTCNLKKRGVLEQIDGRNSNFSFIRSLRTLSHVNSIEMMQ